MKIVHVCNMWPAFMSSLKTDRHDVNQNPGHTMAEPRVGISRFRRQGVMLIRKTPRTKSRNQRELRKNVSIVRTLDGLLDMSDLWSCWKFMHVSDLEKKLRSYKRQSENRDNQKLAPNANPQKRSVRSASMRRGSLPIRKEMRRQKRYPWT